MSSSDPSGQSWFELHRKCELVQFPSLHWNWPSLQWRRGHVDGSSEPSLQSRCPSHFHQIGMQLHRDRQRTTQEQMQVSLWNNTESHKSHPGQTEAEFWSAHRSLLAHLYCVLEQLGRHRATPPICTVRKWSGHWQVYPRPPAFKRHRWEQPPLFSPQGLVTEDRERNCYTTCTYHKESEADLPPTEIRQGYLKTSICLGKIRDL